ncbi:MAG: transposase [Acidobacteria bacterium]|nr:transposase [Acidobacteriota bacterium]
MHYLGLLERYARFEQDVLANPYPLFDHLRVNEPVCWCSALQCWVITRYEDVFVALRDPRFSSGRINALLLAFFAFPRHLWRKLRTTNVIERCFVEVRRRTRPMVCFVNVRSVDRILYSIFRRFNDQWRNRTLRLFTLAG